MNIAILGAGNVGQALGEAWRQAGHVITYAVRDPQAPKYQALAEASGATLASVAAATRSADLIVLATPWSATHAALQEAGALAGKIVIDATNPLAADYSQLVLGHTDSGGEQVQRWLPQARVVKAFNSVGFNIMQQPRHQDQASVMYVAGDDAAARAQVIALAAQIGFDPVDAGPLQAARLIEQFAMLWIATAYRFGLGREFAFTLQRRG